MTVARYQAWDRQEKVMYHDPIINGMNGNVLIVDFPTIIGELPKERIALRPFTGMKDFFSQEIWAGDKLYAHDNSGEEEYIGFVEYDEELGRFFVSGFSFIPNECYVKGHIYEDDNEFVVVEDIVLEIGKCDFCELDGRYLKEMNDECGNAVLAQCLYGCDNEKSIPNEPQEDIELISINKTYQSYCHDSKWEVSVKVNDEPKVYQIVRYSSETEDELKQEILACRNRFEIQRLNKTVYHN